MVHVGKHLKVSHFTIIKFWLCSTVKMLALEYKAIKLCCYAFFSDESLSCDFYFELEIHQLVMYAESLLFSFFELVG